MLFQAPLDLEEEMVALRRIDDVARKLGYALSNPKRWTGILRRLALAGNIQGSNSIEGYRTSLEDAIAAIEDEDPFDTSKRDWAAVVGYRNAMTYILALGDDPYFTFNTTLIRILHFMMLHYDPSKFPGRWRPRPVRVIHAATGAIVYEAPDAGQVPELMETLADTLMTDDGTHPMIRAAMMHLNMAMIHPFSDGNGRMARALQTLMLVRQGIGDPVLASIEEWLGHNTEQYYGILRDTGGVSWDPHRETRSWIRFCLQAHYQCATKRLNDQQTLALIWDQIESLREKFRLPERVDIALAWAAMHYRVRNATYRSMNDISDSMASRDLKALVDHGLLEPRGERRGRYYVGSDLLRSETDIQTAVPQCDDLFAPAARDQQD